jgi:hypothetical protein
MFVSTLKVPTQIRNLIRRLHPQLKRKVRAALGRTRIIYRPSAGGAEIVAIGPRKTIYEDAFRQIVKDREKP